jgi:DNA-binding MarR family transcriptional regulator
VKSDNGVSSPVALTAPSSRTDSDDHHSDDHKQELRIWLRLFASTTLIENEIRSRLREHFAFTLPRFDLLAQLDRAHDGLSLGEISRRLMVSAANITAIVEKLVEDGYITRSQSQVDRRTQIIRMTHAGRSAFRTMATAHSEWITEFLSDFSPEDLVQLNAVLTQLKHTVQKRLSKADGTSLDPDDLRSAADAP